ncbi:formate dehydrogenase accessory sulfurtransferase FdhD [Sporotomaculum syntrophicum]|nr:formate dehydrogenase accessory sulfurtransferase FdhD [Sporotomaculum syntrophicum]
MSNEVDVLDIPSVEADICVECERFSDGKWVSTIAHVPNELKLTIYVNKLELVTVLCTPTKLNNLVLGFLYGEGIISCIDDILWMRTCEEENVSDVRLIKPEFTMPAHRTLTPGCGGGATFTSEGQKVESDLVVTPMEVLALVKQLLEQMELYKVSGGVHTSAIADHKNLLVVAEDIGRHNTLDKIQGECLMRDLATKDKILLSTGRISSEMLIKAAKMQTPVIVSRHSPTGGAVLLALELGITLVGHARAGSLRVYTHPERLGRIRNYTAGKKSG